MQRTVLQSAFLCLLFATLYSGCIFVEEDCDYYETQCWDVVDVYCDPWGCWEDWYTECEDICVNLSEPVVVPECTSDRHCSGDFVCQGERCVPTPDDRPQAGLCEACDVNADCAERGAFCLNLTPEASIGYCGRECFGDGDCPSNFECVDLEGASGQQCVPITRSCAGLDPAPAPECTDNAGCDAPQICIDNECANPECDESNVCGDSELCVDGLCVDQAPECVDNSGCTEAQICVENECVEPQCSDNSECTDPQICVDRLCVDPPPECSLNDHCTDPQICIEGSCSDPECLSDEECDSLSICVEGLCEDPECIDNAECDTLEECVDGRCQDIEFITCERNVDCEDGVCVDGSCASTCEIDDECPGNLVCRAGLCSTPPEPECTVGADCTEEGDFYCVNAMCRPACEADEDCDAGYFCRSFYCDVDPNVECRSDLECGLDEVCSEGTCYVECAASCNCPSGLTCDETEGICRDLPMPDSCETDCDCPGGYSCSGDSVCVAN